LKTPYAVIDFIYLVVVIAEGRNPGEVFPEDAWSSTLFTGLIREGLRLTDKCPNVSLFATDVVA
jgi:hypothetical protein